MSERSERFNKRRRERAERTLREHLWEVADQGEVAALLAARDGAEDRAAITVTLEAEWSLEADQYAARRDASTMLAVVRNEFDAARRNQVIRAARRSVIESIVGPFGVGHLVARLDKDGGPVTTVHNADVGVFAKEDERANYSKNYVYSDYDKNGATPSERENRSGYTNKVLERKDKPDLDHVVSLYSFHADKLLRLATKLEERKEMANHPDNIVLCEQNINRSKGKHPFEVWSSKTQPDGQRNDEAFGIDPKKAQATVTKANRAKARQKTVAVVRHFGGEVVLAGAGTGARLGVQQAIGLLASELADSLFDELQDVLAQGFKSGIMEVGFLEALGERLGRVSKRLLRRWKDVLRVIGDGAFAGVISTVLTFVVNTFLTTARNVVRMIREGAMSLWKAVKLLMSPPPGMTLREAAHEASKIILAGAVGVGGVALDEVIAKTLGGFPMAVQLTTVLVGIVSGLAMAFGVWLLDKLDMLGVVAEARDADAVNQLEPHRMAAQVALERTLAEMELLLRPGEAPLSVRRGRA